MSNLEQEMYNFSINENYFSPIIDIEKSRKSASEKIWEIRKGSKSIIYANKIIKKHVNS